MKTKIKTYEIVKLFGGFAVREAPTKNFFGKIIETSSYIDYFDVPRDTDDPLDEIFGMGHTWSSRDPKYVRKYCIFKDIEDAEDFITALQKDERDCNNPKVVKTVQVQ